MADTRSGAGNKQDEPGTRKEGRLSKATMNVSKRLKN